MTNIEIAQAIRKTAQNLAEANNAYSPAPARQIVRGQLRELFALADQVEGN